MPVQLGAHVRTSDDKDVGSIERLIIDPTSGEATAAVIRKGFLLTEDVQIPLSALHEDPGGQVRLSYTADQVKDLPRFQEADFTLPPTDYRSPFGYPTAGLLWPVDYLPAAPSADAAAVDLAERDEILRQRGWDPDKVVIDQGSDVIGRDGEKVGEVHSVAVDATTGRPTKIVVRKGFLFAQDVELPAEAIERVSHGAVYLKLDKEQVKSHTQFVI